MTKIKNFIFIVFGLQLFADVTNATTSNTTGNDLSAEMVIYYDKNLLKEAGPYLVHRQFAQKRNIPKNNGKTINFRKYDSLPKAKAPLVEGVKPNGQALNVTSVNCNVNQYGAYVRITDMLELTGVDKNVIEAQRLLGSQAGRTLDTIDRDEMQSCTNASFASKWSGTTETEVTMRHQLDNTSILTVELVERVAAKLKAQNAPTFDDNCYIAIIHPYNSYQLRRDKEWQNVKEYNPGDFYKGEIGKIGGVRFIETTEAKIYCGENLAGTTRNLAVNGAVTANTQKTITFDGGTVAEHALKDRKIIVGGNLYEVDDNTATVITVKGENLPAIADDAVIYPGEGSSDGGAVFGTLFLGRDAYGDTEVEGGGLQSIVKPLGSGGTYDPLNQISTAGWKAIAGCKLLLPQYICRVESCVPKFYYAEEN